jgi:hypothetical protein
VPLGIGERGAEVLVHCDHGFDERDVGPPAHLGVEGVVAAPPGVNAAERLVIVPYPRGGLFCVGVVDRAENLRNRPDQPVPRVVEEVRMILQRRPTT